MVANQVRNGLLLLGNGGVHAAQGMDGAKAVVLVPVWRSALGLADVAIWRDGADQQFVCVAHGFRGLQVEDVPGMQAVKGARTENHQPSG